MKKILSVLMACVMLCALAACTNPNPDDNRSYPESSVGEPATSTNSDVTSTAESSDEQKPGWSIKDIVMPVFTELEVREMTVTQHNGSDVKGKVAVSPLSLDTYNPATAMETLKKNPLFDGWVFGLEDFERGKVTMYKDIGQQTAYDWQKRIVATDAYLETDSGFYDFMVQYCGETQDTIGYTGIRVEINIPAEKRSADIQQHVYAALEAVYGAKYAEVLCYAPIQRDNVIYEQELQSATILFSRNISDYGLVFNLSVNTHIRSVFEGYAGPGDYKPITTTPEYFHDIFGEKFGDCDVTKYSEIGAKMLGMHYAEYTNTVPGYTSAYRYRVLTGENGHKVVDFALEGMVGQKETGKLVLPDFELEYTVVSANGKITDKEGSVECGVGLVSNHADPEATRTDMLARAIRMMDCLFHEEPKLDGQFVRNEEAKEYNTVKKTLKILGEDTDVSFEFKFGETMADTFVGYIDVKF